MPLDSNIFLTHRQLVQMAKVTDGYHPENTYELMVTAQGIAYLEVMHITYCIDREGTYSARQTSDGSEMFTRTWEMDEEARCP